MGFRIVLVFLMLSSIGWSAKSTLEGKARHLNSYFVNPSNLRHHQYEVSLTEKTSISARVLTVAEGRARTNLSLGSKYSDEVKKDELLEFDARQAYLDYIDEKIRLKAGLQQFDWVETFTPFTTDLLTPFDLRFGGMGDASQILVPMLSAILNHKVGKGTLEYVFVPLPKHSWLAKGDNGYGYYPSVQNSVTPFTAVIKEEEIPVKYEEVEFGMRYLLNFNEIDFTLLGYYGHQRAPSYVTEVLSPTQIQITQKYPRVLTLGSFVAYSQDAWVLRGFFFAEPNREARTQLGPIVNSPPTEQRYRLGGGFDYVFSKALKVYSELAATFTKISDYQISVKATNESWKNLILSLNTTLTFPKFSFLISPECSYNLNPYTLVSLGATLVGSNDAESDFNSLKNTSRLYLKLEYNFDIF